MNGHAAVNGSSSSSSANDVNLDDMEYDPMQLEMMKEELIVVDYDDKPIGQESKKTCASIAVSCCSLLGLARLCTSADWALSRRAQRCPSRSTRLN